MRKSRKGLHLKSRKSRKSLHDGDHLSSHKRLPSRQPDLKIEIFKNVLENSPLPLPKAGSLN